MIDIVRHPKIGVLLTKTTDSKRVDGKAATGHDLPLAMPSQYERIDAVEWRLYGDELGA